ncbi:MAG: hypothetical protein HC813_02105 [Planctomycetes bacterium]|nr:hypothetical protein [Planctomycetota bacterium]
MNLKLILSLSLVALLVACGGEKEAPATPSKPAGTASKPANPLHDATEELPAAAKAITLKVDGMS